jgi:hypothetical protein
MEEVNHFGGIVELIKDYLEKMPRGEKSTPQSQIRLKFWS